MCEGKEFKKECPLRLKCKRYIIKPNIERQSYFIGIPYENGHCEFLKKK